ncbi:acyloxyacyl hydrolase [Taibaiella lutea]|uniref:Acyloxyacyl hydrolase n=1 Tax=Taibaiella lutea TaxID=2608001 RepID=A0A5M6CTV0_9BACT|nr:acyloxyacyl hydrolase [Taibaiella lutea]KAA5536435.1 acyloxyacyl hydrolase [Taibaiella lutea]
MNRWLLTFLVTCCFQYNAVAQENGGWKGFGIETNFTIGKMIKHTPKFTGPIPDHSYSFELNLIKKTYGQKDWQQRRHYPQIGIGFYYNNYNMPDVYGQAFGIFPNIQLNIIKGDHFEWTVRAGMGVGYDTRPYEREPNPNLENVAIGGHWNNISPFSTDIRWKVNEHWDLQAGVCFSHVSNAAFQQPNLGINMYGAHFGLRYFPVTSKPELIKRTLQPLKNRWLLQARYSMAFIESSPADGPLNPVYTGALFVSKRYWSKNKVYGGVDYTYNSAKYAKLKSIEHFQGQEYKESTQAAVFLGNEFLIGRLGILFQAGYYLHKMDEQTDNIYEKLGGNFYLVQKEKGPLKELFFTALLKTHAATAEFFEMGIGVGF